MYLTDKPFFYLKSLEDIPDTIFEFKSLHL
jgi:hypothetical protein